MVTYMDRAVISSAMPVIQKEFGFSIITAGWILMSFRIGYALFQLPGGWLEIGLDPSSADPHCDVVEFVHFRNGPVLERRLDDRSSVSVRGGRSGRVPHRDAIAFEMDATSERGYAQGVTHAGSRLGAAFTPPIVVLLMTQYTWRAPFFIFGCVGVLWAILWYWYYRDTPSEHRSVNQAELQ